MSTIKVKQVVFVPYARCTIGDANDFTRLKAFLLRMSQVNAFGGTVDNASG